MVDIPAELRVRRARLNHTQAEAAAALGVSPATVTRWERGEYLAQVPVWRAQLIADYLGIPLGDTCEGLLNNNKKKEAACESPT